jgi:hypothetical protein
MMWGQTPDSIEGPQLSNDILAGLDVGENSNVVIRVGDSVATTTTTTNNTNILDGLQLYKEFCTSCGTRNVITVYKIFSHLKLVLIQFKLHTLFL